MLSRKLKPKQQRFVEEYLIDFNGAQAAIRAGYSPKTARAISSELLTKPDILDAIDAGRQRLTETSNLKSEQVLHQLACVCMADPRKLVDARGRLRKLHQLDPQTAAAIASVEYSKGKIKYRFWSKTEGLNLAGRYLKLFKDDAPMQPQAGMFVLLGPATATPDEWMKLVEQHHKREAQ